MFELQYKPNVRLKSLLMIVTRDNYQDVYKRSYTLNVTNNNINKFQDLMFSPAYGNVPSAPAKEINSNVIADNLHNIIGYNPAVCGTANIANGWATARLRYLLEVETMRDTGTMEITYVQGYSEYYDPTMTGKLDPNMIFHVNSIFSVIKTINPVTGMTNVVPKHVLNIISKEANRNDYGNTFETTYELVRPQDIIGSEYLESVYGVSGTKLVDMTSSLSGNQPKTSRKINNNPYKYLSKAVNNFITARTTADISHDINDILRASANIKRDPDVLEVSFLDAINAITGEFNPTSFTLNVLNAIDPTLLNSNRVNIIDRTSIGIRENYNNMLDSDITESTLQPTQYNLKATFIANILPSLMLDCFLTKVELSFTNTSLEPTIIVSNANSFIADLDLRMYVDTFVTLIKSNILPSLSDDGYTIYEVFVSCDVIGDISIGISLNSQPHIVYRFPMFADGLFSPVITNSDQKAMLSNDFTNVLDATYSPFELANGMSVFN